jgi:hypothetical protein
MAGKGCDLPHRSRGSTGLATTNWVKLIMVGSMFAGVSPIPQASAIVQNLP